MKKALLFLTMIISLNSVHAQNLKADDESEFTTIGYFSSKNLIAIKCRILKLENYTFLQIALDNELYVNDYNASEGVNFSLSLNSEDLRFSEMLYITPISNKVEDKDLHLILLRETEIETLKKSKITEIEISMGFSTTYNFKNIKEPNFFINNLK